MIEPIQGLVEAQTGASGKFRFYGRVYRSRRFTRGFICYKCYLPGYPEGYEIYREVKS